jgi:hypothetical protein
VWVELIGQNVDHVGGLELPVDPDGQTFVRELVDEVEHAILPPFARAILDEVLGPDMVEPSRSRNADRALGAAAGRDRRRVGIPLSRGARR